MSYSAQYKILTNQFWRLCANGNNHVMHVLATATLYWLIFLSFNELRSKMDSDDMAGADKPSSSQNSKFQQGQQDAPSSEKVTTPVK